MRRIIAVILSNDAVPTTQPYEKVGPMSAQRVEDAWAWSERRGIGSGESLIWACGAGVKDASRPGATLAACNMLALFQPGRRVPVLYNISDRVVWGTPEEIRWVIQRAQEEFPDDELKFVFFTAEAHMPRVKFTVWVLFPEVSAEFVETSEPLNLSRFIELVKCGKVLWLWCKWTTLDLLAVYGESKLREQGVDIDRG
jgi:hypothetical protein